MSSRISQRISNGKRTQTRLLYLKDHLFIKTACTKILNATVTDESFARRWSKDRPMITLMLGLLYQSNFRKYRMQLTELLIIDRKYIAQLRQRIVEALASVTPAMLLNTEKETEYRLNMARATNGAHKELYLVSKKLQKIIFNNMQV